MLPLRNLLKASILLVLTTGSIMPRGLNHPQSGGMATALSLSNYHGGGGEDNCLLTFVVPRDKVKTSCDINAKVQRRLSSMEVRADVYRQQVAEVRAQLDKQTAESQDRLTKVEAEMRSGSGSGHPGQWHQMSRRLVHLEKNLIQLQAKIAASSTDSAAWGKSQRVHSRDDKGDNDDTNMFNTISNSADDILTGHHSWMRREFPDVTNDDMDVIKSLVKAQVQSEVSKLTAGLREYIQEQVVAYNQVFSLLMPPSGRSVRDMKGGKTVAQSDGVPTDSLSSYNKDDMDEVDGLLKNNFKQMKSGDDVSKNSENVGRVVQNVTKTSDVDKRKNSNVNVGSQRGVAVLDTEEELYGETNDTFSGDHSDLNTTGPPDFGELDGDYLISSARIGHHETEKDKLGDTEHEQRRNNPQMGHAEVPPDWLRDGIPEMSQSKMDEEFRKEIRSMLISPLAEIMGRVEKRAVAIEVKIRDQGMRDEEAVKEVVSRVEGIEKSSQSSERRMDTLSQQLIDATDQIGRLKDIETTVQNLKKNLSSSHVTETEGDTGADIISVQNMDALSKRVKKLERLTGIYKETVDHDRNYTKEELRKVKTELVTETAEMKRRAKQLSERLDKTVTSVISDLNTTYWLRLEELSDSLRDLDDSAVMRSLDWSRQNRERDNRIKSGMKKLRSATENLKENDYEFRRKLDRLETTQVGMVTQLNETSTAVSNLKIDLRLSFKDSGWVPFQFEFDVSRTGCFGDQYIKLSGYRTARLVGVVLCSPERYKIFLASSRHGKFLNIGDSDGMGDDHCEFVGGKKGEKVKLSPLSTRFDSIKGYSRNGWGDEPISSYINMIKPSPQWYECGVSIP